MESLVKLQSAINDSKSKEHRFKSSTNNSKLSIKAHKQKASSHKPPKCKFFSAMESNRVLGVGYYAFSQNEDKRAMQIQNLNSIRQDTESMQKSKQPRAQRLKNERLTKLVKIHGLKHK
eukprot:NODE_96_length_21330_cov_0.419858.p11 type:complete len:119 gc:universal NODE_96_length_21330_cov_0.419858:14580-14224(-)